jgi:hypothetical protein
VVLEFSAPPDPGQSHLSTRDSSGAEVGTGVPDRDGSTGLRLPVSIRAAGNYTVAYHVVFGDGTDVTGALRFSVGTGAPPPPVDGLSAGHDHHAVDPLSGALLVADVVVLVAVVLMLLRRPRPGGDI